ncbi:tetratricopeptide repeat-containing sensor histidine kinase [Pedobacter aquatilis]|uniref:tetratricopeptide repeat-containing sensor histidine kinase n=1 Tax=Pedobacter aquatilis TaxID=351343 RepID=UPI0025B29A11|nr:tetratricopeptide repeat-containing sensor histidine kinase [Pedobacter aquatilis]MDN3588586.1 tetratricopeptide repeat-containing sensor histidine kinase [Pedobacter aquatilis]
MKTLYLIMREYMILKNFPKIDEYYQKSLQLSQSLNKRSFSAVIYNRRALFNHGLANYLEAEKYYYKALNEYQRLKDGYMEAGIYLNLSALYGSIPDYAKSLEVNQKAIILYQKTNSQDDLASCYINIAAVYQALGQQISAADYGKRALRIFTINNDQTGIAYAYLCLGESYVAAKSSDLVAMKVEPENKLSIALDYFNKGLKISETSNNQLEISSFKRNIGKVYEQQGKADLALNHYLDAIKIDEQTGQKGYYADNLKTLGIFYKNQKKYNIALETLILALKISREKNFIDTERDVLLILSDIYLDLNKHRESLDYYKQYIIAKDKLFNEEKEREITRRQLIVDFGVKENDYKLKQQVSDAILKQQYFLARQQEQMLLLRKKELEFVGQQKNLQSSNYERSKLQSAYDSYQKNKQISEQKKQIEYDEKVKIFLIVAITLIIFTAGLIYFNQRKTTRLNVIINKQKRELEQLSRVKDRIFSVVSHDMRTPVNSLISFIQLLEAGKIDQDKLTKYASSLKNSLTHTSSMMENLLNWAASQMQGFNPYLEPLNISDLTNEIVIESKNIADLKNISIVNNILPNTMCNADENMLSLVLRNLINNSIKFTPNDGTIIISSEVVENELVISLADNGIGMSAEQVEHFNESAFQGAGFSTLGTNRERGTGLGLLLCRTFMALMEGKIELFSAKNEGTKFNLIFKRD